jgi:elongation factor P
VLRVKVKHLRTGAIVEQTFKSGERFQDIQIDKKKVQYLYAAGTVFHVMDTTSYEQLELTQDLVGENAKFLKENMEINLELLNGSIIGIELPTSVNLKITYTEPGVKGDTATRTQKPATLETGSEVKVPLFINTGDTVKIDTRTGEYVERA